MRRVSIVSAMAIVMLSSCVSKKKYVALENDLADTKGQLTKTQVEKKSLKPK